MSVNYTDATVTLHHGDCLDVLRSLPDASVDSVVTDPPYGLEFMGKEWDSFKGDNRQPFRGEIQTPDNPYGRSTVRFAGSATYGGKHAVAMRQFQDWCESWAKECLRVLKPGGHLLAFGGTRTSHRLACAIEDAGFEIRDSIAWLYGSGFPKSLDVSKAIDKAAGAEREVVGFDAIAAAKANRRPAGEMNARYRNSDAANDNGATITAPATPDAERWQGWGTALKPAHEPVVVGRKPLAGTVAANVLAHGTGALNVDGCRTATSDADKAAINAKHAGMNVAAYERKPGDSLNLSTNPMPLTGASAHAAGRWPANVILDESQAAVLDEQTVELKGGVSVNRNRDESADKPASVYGTFKCDTVDVTYGDQGGASRFFYVAKADASERVRVDGIAHPTVKPLSIMRWLVRLVTPPGGTVLEPFAGSGTTVEACILEGFRCVAIEREADYLPLIRQRIHRRRDPVAAVKATGDDGGLFDLLDGGAA